MTSTGNVFKATVCSVWSGLLAQAPEVIPAGTSGTAASVSYSITPITNFALVVDCASHKPVFTRVAAGQTLLVSEAGQSFEHCTASYKVVSPVGATTMGQTWGSSNSYAYAVLSWACVILLVPRPSLAPGTSMITGSYLGDGVDGKKIIIGFQPDLVILKAETAQNGVFRTSAYATNAAGFFLNAANGTATIKSFIAQGFTVGTGAEVNSVGVKYHWTALKIDPNALELAVGTYTGTGASLPITGLGFTPDFVLTKGSSTTKSIFRDSSDVGDVSHYPDSTANGTGLITSLDSGGFTLGTHADVNGNGVVYYWFALKAVTGRIKVGTYTGDAADDRNITGVGFRPRFVLLKRDGASSCAMRMSTYIGDLSSNLAATALTGNRIQAFGSDGFQIGQDSSVNTAATVYHYIALMAYRTRTVSPARPANPNY